VYLINRSDNQAKNFPTIKSRKGEGKLPPKNPTAGTAGSKACALQQKLQAQSLRDCGAGALSAEWDTNPSLRGIQL